MQVGVKVMRKWLKMDKCREEFEHYMLKSGYTKCELSKSNHYDCYHDITIDAMYSAWKASRESMKAIKFPEELTPEYEGDGYKSRYEEAYCKGYNQALRDCEKQITSAGYKVE